MSVIILEDVTPNVLADWRGALSRVRQARVARTGRSTDGGHSFAAGEVLLCIGCVAWRGTGSCCPGILRGEAPSRDTKRCKAER